MAVSLSKGQTISLEKEAAAGGGLPPAGLEKVVMGLGWDVQKVKKLFGGSKPGPPVDLDASCVLFDQGGNMVDAVWFRQLRSKDGSIQHTGDNRTGAGEGDDEQILVDLTRVPPHVKSLVFVVNSFTGQSFATIENAFCRLVDTNNGQEIARFDLSCQGNHTAQIMARVFREGAAWRMQAIGENCSGQTFDRLVPAIQPHL